MIKQVLVVAPHPDDETLGCGGTLLKHREKGDMVSWLIVTSIRPEEGFTCEQVSRREEEIRQVAAQYNIAQVLQLGFPTTRLDQVPLQELVTAIGRSIMDTKPDTVYVPYRGDVHTDHAMVFDAVAACTKWFRYPFVKRVLAYETLSETDFGLNPDSFGFQPNLFVNVEPYLEDKIKIMGIYSSEIGNFPFPRSEEAIRALAKVRGAASGFQAAEAFMLLRERWE